MVIYPMTGNSTGAELFIRSLEEYGVDHLFGNPGTTELPIVDAVDDSSIEYVLTLHEDVAVGAAAGYASARRYHAESGRSALTAVNLHLTPGVAHGLGNLYGAWYTGAPVIVTAGAQTASQQANEPALSGETRPLVKDYTKFAETVRTIEALPQLIRRAARIALTPPTGPVFLEIPYDVQIAETPLDPAPLGHIPQLGPGDPAAIETATELVTEADDIVIVVGDHVARAGTAAVAATVEVAEALGARVHGEILLSEASFPTDHEQWVSFLPVDPDETKSLLRADAVVFIGCSTNYPLFDFEGNLVSDGTKCIHIGPEPQELGKNLPAELAIRGDPGEIMQQFARELQGEIPEEIRAERLQRVRKMHSELAGQPGSRASSAAADARPSPSELGEALSELHSEELIVDEGVTAGFLIRNHLDLRPGEFLAIKSGGLGYGLPAAVGAAVAEETRDEPKTVVGLLGDGSFQYYPQAMYTAARYVDTALSVLVVDNSGYKILRDNDIPTRTAEDPPPELSFDPGIDPAAIATGYGVDGVRIETREELSAGLSRAINADEPILVNVSVAEQR